MARTVRFSTPVWQNRRLQRMSGMCGVCVREREIEMEI